MPATTFVDDNVCQSLSFIRQNFQGTAWLRILKHDTKLDSDELYSATEKATRFLSKVTKLFLTIFSFFQMFFPSYQLSINRWQPFQICIHDKRHQAYQWKQKLGVYSAAINKKSHYNQQFSKQKFSPWLRVSWHGAFFVDCTFFKIPFFHFDRW